MIMVIISGLFRQSGVIYTPMPFLRRLKEVLTPAVFA